MSELIETVSRMRKTGRLVEVVIPTLTKKPITFAKAFRADGYQLYAFNEDFDKCYSIGKDYHILRNLFHGWFEDHPSEIFRIPADISKVVFIVPDSYNQYRSIWLSDKRQAVYYKIKYG